MPSFFLLTADMLHSHEVSLSVSSSAEISIRDSSMYLTVEEITRVLKTRLFIASQEKKTLDRWAPVNRCRSFVSHSFTCGLSQILQPLASSSSMIEIGSGIGYKIGETISSQLIRTQPHHQECELLSASVSGPVYQLNMEQLHRKLFKTGKKVSLFFALNVLDTMCLAERRSTFSQISSLQFPGDRFLILLDTNPCLNTTLDLIEDRYPGYIAFPYFPKENKGMKMKMTFILIPQETMPSKPSVEELQNIMETESRKIRAGQVSEIQEMHYALKEKFNLRLIVLEDFFVEQMKRELAQTGYASRHYYHVCFEEENSSQNFSRIQQPLVYKAVSDQVTVRQWKFTDPYLIEALREKNLSLPSHFDDAFEEELKQKNKKIFGAEILVIEATKM